MQKTTRAATLAATLWLAMGFGRPETLLAQDAEEAAVELDEPAVAEPGSATNPPPAAPGPAWEGDPTEKHEPKEEPGTGPGNLRLYLGPRVGVGGGFRPKDTDVVYVAKVTPGFQVGVDYVLWRYFALSGETRLDWAAVKENDAKFMFWSLMAKPRLRYALESSPLEIYLAVPGGLSLSDPKASNMTGKISGMVGIFAGASYWFNKHWGLNAELGWTWHWLHYEAKVPGNGPPQGINGLPALVKVDQKVTFAQLTLLAVNVSYAF